MNIDKIMILKTTPDTTLFTVTYKTWYGKLKTIECIVSSLVTLEHNVYKTDGSTWYDGSVADAVRVYADLAGLVEITKFKSL